MFLDLRTQHVRPILAARRQHPGPPGLRAARGARLICLTARPISPRLRARREPKESGSPVRCS